MPQKRNITIIILLVLLIATVILGIKSLHGFLCLNKANSCGILVVESWVPKISLSEISSIYSSGNYKMIVVVGGPLRHSTWSSTYRTRARMLALGLDKNSIIPVQHHNGTYHQTYWSAIALKDWLLKSKISTRFVDIYTVGVHSRKSYTIFNRVLSPAFKVGVISGTPLYYRPGSWFLSKTGIYLVFKNFFGYLYGKFFPFYLLAPDTDKPAATQRDLTQGKCEAG